MKKLKDFWWLYITILAIAGGLITFGDSLTAIASAPKQVSKLEQAVIDYVKQDDERSVRQEVLIEQNGRLINLLLTRRIDNEADTTIGG